MHGFPVVGVSVALVADGVPVVGVVQAPMLGDVYAARLGGGAFRDDEPIRVSRRARPSARSAPPGSRSGAKRQRLAEYVPVFERALLTFEDLRRAGAASLDLAWTAAGVFDGYFEQNLGTWDVAAGALLVREAGGVVTDWQGDDRAWLQSGDIVAGPPDVHARHPRDHRGRRLTPDRHGRCARKRAATSPSGVYTASVIVDQALLRGDRVGQPVAHEHHHETRSRGRRTRVTTPCRRGRTRAVPRRR